MKYKDLQKIFEEYFSLSTLGNDFSDRIALIGLICYLYNVLKIKNPDLTYWNLVYKLGKDKVSEKEIIKLSIICENLGKNCTNFQNFGIKDNKEIIKKIRELLHNWFPF